MLISRTLNSGVIRPYFYCKYGNFQSISSMQGRHVYLIEISAKCTPPYTVVAGDKELESKSVAICHRRGGDLGLIPFTKFVERLTRDVNERT